MILSHGRRGKREATVGCTGKPESENDEDVGYPDHYVIFRCLKKDSVRDVRPGGIRWTYGHMYFAVFH